VSVPQFDEQPDEQVHRRRQAGVAGAGYADVTEG
jgi:hypothetical protein